MRKEALFYTRLENERVQCNLCPHRCILANGKMGICRVRKNVDGKLVALSYGWISSCSFDPVEKKPLYHFYPGQPILSIGSVGCNMRCRFCQNDTISQTGVEGYNGLTRADPAQVADLALSRSNNIGVAYTYNEPLVGFEFMMDVAVAIHRRGAKNVLVTNGFIEPEPLNQLLAVTDAFSIDLKGFTEAFYRQYTSSSLAPVKKTLERIVASGRHLEVVHLIIPKANDNPADFQRMVSWIRTTLGRETVLHLSRYFPCYQMTTPATPVSTIEAFAAIAREKLDYVYCGNVPHSTGQDTLCPVCNHRLIRRNGYSTRLTGLGPGAVCQRCGHKIPIIMP